MRLSTALLPLSLLALASCNGGDADAFSLVQKGEYAAAISAAEAQLDDVEEGSEDHKELVIVYSAALAKERPDDARDAFLEFAKAHPDLIEPTDFRYVDGQLRMHGQLVASVDVMDAGKKRWPDDPVMAEVLEALKQQIASSGDADAAAKMKGLGYM